MNTVRLGRVLVRWQEDGTLAVLSFWRTYEDLDLASRRHETEAYAAGFTEPE